MHACSFSNYIFLHCREKIKIKIHVSYKYKKITVKICQVRSLSRESISFEIIHYMGT